MTLLPSGTMIRTTEPHTWQGKTIPAGWVGSILQVLKDHQHEPMYQVAWMTDGSLTKVRPDKVERA